jgi:hypothetical protein
MGEVGLSSPRLAKFGSEMREAFGGSHVAVLQFSVCQTIKICWIRRPSAGGRHPSGN